MASCLGRYVFLSEQVQVLEEMYCPLEENRFFSFYQLSCNGRVYQLSYEKGKRLEDEIEKFFLAEGQDAITRVEDSILTYADTLKPEYWH